MYSTGVAEALGTIEVDNDIDTNDMNLSLQSDTDEKSGKHCSLSPGIILCSCHLRPSYC